MARHRNADRGLDRELFLHRAPLRAGFVRAQRFDRDKRSVREPSEVHRAHRAFAEPLHEISHMFAVVHELEAIRIFVLLCVCRRVSLSRLAFRETSVECAVSDALEEAADSFTERDSHRT